MVKRYPLIPSILKSNINETTSDYSLKKVVITTKDVRIND